MRHSTCPSRRMFLKGTAIGGLAAMGGLSWPDVAHAAENPGPAAAVGEATRVGLTTGSERADMTFRALKDFSKEVAAAIGQRRVVIKPNNVAIDNQLAATHADCIEGILEFLKSIGKIDNVAIAESAANGPTLEGFSNYKYDKVAAKYGAKLVLRHP